MSIDRRTDKQNVVHIHNGSYSALKRRHPDTCYNIDNLDHRCQSEMTNICDAIIGSS